jgi:hypothetical protein
MTPGAVDTGGPRPEAELGDEQSPARPQLPRAARRGKGFLLLEKICSDFYFNFFPIFFHCKAICVFFLGIFKEFYKYLENIREFYFVCLVRLRRLANGEHLFGVLP